LGYQIKNIKNLDKKEAMSLEKKNDLIKAIEHQLQGMTVEEGEEY